VPDQQQPAVGPQRADRLERLLSVEPIREWRVLAQLSPLLLAPRLRRQLRGLASAHARAEQHRVERGAKPLQREARSARLLLAALGQAPLGVGARAVRLCLCVTK